MATKTYDLYGFSSNDVEAIRKSVEEALGIRFEPHESSFRGDYYLYENGEEAITLQQNYNAIEQEYMEGKFPAMGALLYIEGTDRAEELEHSLKRAAIPCTLLKRELL